MTIRSLLDINLLLALFDSTHVHHQRAIEWWDAAPGNQSWASCPLTQNGFVRVVSKPSYPHRYSVTEALAAIAAQMVQSDHEPWPDDISITNPEIFDQGRFLGPNQITDVYLLALAVKHGGRLVTFDRGIPIAAVRGAEARHLVVL